MILYSLCVVKSSPLLLVTLHFSLDLFFHTHRIHILHSSECTFETCAFGVHRRNASARHSHFPNKFYLSFDSCAPFSAIYPSFHVVKKFIYKPVKKEKMNRVNFTIPPPEFYIPMDEHWTKVSEWKKNEGKLCVCRAMVNAIPSNIK